MIREMHKNLEKKNQRPLTRVSCGIFIWKICYISSSFQNTYKNHCEHMNDTNEIKRILKLWQNHKWYIRVAFNKLYAQKSTCLDSIINSVLVVFSKYYHHYHRKVFWRLYKILNIALWLQDGAVRERQTGTKKNERLKKNIERRLKKKLRENFKE